MVHSGVIIRSLYFGGIIHLLVKHNVPDIVQFYNPFQVILLIHYRENISVDLVIT